MLQKLSKCEVKAWFYWDLIILPPLQFLCGIKFWWIQTVQTCHFCFRDSEIWILVNFGLVSCSNWLKSRFRAFKIAKNDIFGQFEIAKIWFHVKSEWGSKIIKFQQSQALNPHFESFWSIVRLKTYGSGIMFSSMDLFFPSSNKCIWSLYLINPDLVAMNANWMPNLL